MKLIEVVSAKATAEDGLLELTIRTEEILPYGWRRGDPHGLGPEIDAWLEAHPITIDPYVPPRPPAELTKAERFDALVASVGLTREDVAELLKGEVAADADPAPVDEQPG